MIAFEIYINGQKRFTAGGEDYQALNAMLGLLRLPLPKPDDVQITFSTSGINSGEMMTVGLWPTIDLKVGDRVEIRVVDAAEVDAPESVEKHERADDDAA
jgi:hypothetical protein